MSKILIRLKMCTLTFQFFPHRVTLYAEFLPMRSRATCILLIEVYYYSAHVNAYTTDTVYSGAFNKATSIYFFNFYIKYTSIYFFNFCRLLTMFTCQSVAVIKLIGILWFIDILGTWHCFRGSSCHHGYANPGLALVACVLHTSSLYLRNPLLCKYILLKEKYVSYSAWYILYKYCISDTHYTAHDV